MATPWHTSGGDLIAVAGVIVDCDTCPCDCSCEFCYAISIAMDDTSGHSGVLLVTSTTTPSLEANGSLNSGGNFSSVWGDPKIIQLCVSVIPFDDGVNPEWPATGTFTICISWQSCGQAEPYCDLVDSDGGVHSMADFSSFCGTYGPDEYCVELGAQCPP